MFFKTLLHFLGLSLFIRLAYAYSPPCPPGYWQDSPSDETCRAADPGHYVPSSGATEELECPKGTFVNTSGASSCCKCCQGWYADQTGQTHCIQCPNVGDQQHGTSDAGSTAQDSCIAGDTPPAVTTCAQNMVGTCPATGPTGPTMKRRNVDLPVRCPRKGQILCPILTGRGGYECIDVQNDLESCGGCIGDHVGNLFDMSGTDCSALPGVGTVRCSMGRCDIQSCARGWVKSLNGTMCERRQSMQEPLRQQGLAGTSFSQEL